MTRPATDPYLPDDKQPLMLCATCAHFQPRAYGEGMTDWASGKCARMGYSKMPASAVCALWERARRRRRGNNEEQSVYRD